LLGISGFAIWISEATADSSTAAVAATRISDAYAHASSAVAEEELWELAYRLHPAPAIRANFDAAAAAMTTALDQVHRYESEPADRQRATDIVTDHDAYLAATKQVFTAVDQGDSATAEQLDLVDDDQSYETIRGEVAQLATRHHDVALADLQALERLEQLGSWLTPTTLALGLALAGLLTLTSRGHRRALVTERAAAVHDSLHDQLTGLPNRTLFLDRLDQALRTGRRAHTATGLLVMNLDRFKDVNDTLGHEHGNQLLRQIGPRLQTTLRDSDTVARLGGDEYAVVLPDVTDLPTLITVAEKLRVALQDPFHVAGIDLDVEASIGVVISGQHGSDPVALVRNANIAMYSAKDQRLGICAYHGHAYGHSTAKLALLGELRRALSGNELLLHYQPKVSLSTGDLVATEALVRWQHPTRGLILPDEFVSVAEHTSLIGPLTRYILAQAIAQARIWADAGTPIPISVNLSARNLLDDQLPNQIAAMLLSQDLPRSLLVLEVTESAIMTDPDRACRLLSKLSKFGLRISIDDFGAGYTSLGQLKTLPISELKIDRSFITNITNDPDDVHIVHSIIDLGHNLGLTIVAEGVETAQVATILAELGCDVAQGYHYSRPLDPTTFDTWRHQLNRL
jgi:diguanylate cyclase (GGDEF)-like protein